MSGTYTTALGDTWDKIAFAVYGDESYAEQLMAANQDAALLATVIFDAGTVLTLPEIDTDTDDGADESEPPWRQS